MIETDIYLLRDIMPNLRMNECISTILSHIVEYNHILI